MLQSEPEGFIKRVKGRIFPVFSSKTFEDGVIMQQSRSIIKIISYCSGRKLSVCRGLLKESEVRSWGGLLRKLSRRLCSGLVFVWCVGILLADLFNFFMVIYACWA